MAPVVPFKRSHKLLPWRRKQQLRPNSTLQDLHTNGDIDTAFLYSTKNLDRRSLNDAPREALPPSMTVTQAEPEDQMIPSPAFSRGIKRKRGINSAPRPLKQPRQLKDEAYIRSTAQIPAASDYPQFPEHFLEMPKQSIKNSVHDLAELRSEYRALGNGKFHCTLHYDSTARKEVAVGEGIGRVCQNAYLVA